MDRDKTLNGCLNGSNGRDHHITTTTTTDQALVKTLPVVFHLSILYFNTRQAVLRSPSTRNFMYEHDGHYHKTDNVWGNREKPHLFMKYIRAKWTRLMKCSYETNCALCTKVSITIISVLQSEFHIHIEY